MIWLAIAVIGGWYDWQLLWLVKTLPLNRKDSSSCPYSARLSSADSCYPANSSGLKVKETLLKGKVAGAWKSCVTFVVLRALPWPAVALAFIILQKNLVQKMNARWLSYIYFIFCNLDGVYNKNIYIYMHTVHIYFWFRKWIWDVVHICKAGHATNLA